MAPRIKITAPLINSRAKAEELLGEIALLTIERNEMKLALDRQLTAAREQFETSIAALQKGIEEKSSLLEGWASANLDEFPPKRKSMEMMHGTIGYRMGTPKLKTLLKKTWAKVLEGIKAMGLEDFVRTKEEVDKERIIAEHAQGTLPKETMRAMGVEVVQEEAFFIEPKLEAVENRIAV